MKDEDKTKAELIKKLKTLRKERDKSTLNDLTERKQIEEVIQESESRFRELFNYMSSGVAIYEAKDNGRDFIIKDFNRAAEKIDKVKKGEIVGKSVLKVFPGVKDFGLFKIFQEVYKTRKPQRHPISLYKDQRITGWRENYVYKLPSGEIAAIYDDITERKQVEKELKNSEERLKILFDYAPDAYYINDLKGNFIDGNKAAERVIGYKRKELIGSSFLKLKLLSLADTVKAAKLLVKNLRGQPTGPDEFVINRKDKSKVTVEISTYPVKIKRRTLVLGIARDITERKQAEEKIEKIQSLRNTVSDINQLLIRAKNESELFQQVCNLLIKVKEIRFVWIGLTNKEDFKVKPVVQAGFENDYLSSIKVTWDDSKYGQGPTGIALKTSQPFIMRNIEHDPKFKPWKNDALKRGYLSSIALPLIHKEETIGALNVYSEIKDAFADEEVKFLKEVAEDITIGIRSLRLELKLQQSYQKLKKTMDATIETVSKIVEVKDPYTAGHQQRVSQLATAIAKELNLSPDKVEGIGIASLIHDIGKISVPTEILSKSIALSDIEFSLIKGHSQIGYDILKSIDFPWPVEEIVLQHHERLNGSGYPQGLKADKIITEAKIIGVADVVEAMSSHRPYRPAFGIDAALEEITQKKGILYDPEVVDICIELFKEKRFKFKEGIYK